MIDDIDKPFREIFPGPTGQHDCLAEMLDIKTRVIDRQPGREWANNLRFLSYDGNTIPEYVDDADADSWRSWQNPWPRDMDDPETDFPLFPPEGAGFVPRLRVIEAKDLNRPELSVYLAISYCWQQENEPVLPTGHYSILRENASGVISCKPSKAPDYFLSAAIHCASVSGIRLIWIDQECIDQDSPDDKENGIQSIDLVYQRSVRGLGIIPEPIEKKEHLEVLMRVKDVSHDYGECLLQDESLHDRAESLTSRLLDMAAELSEFLGIIGASRWFKRAWIFQENVCVGNRMFLLFRISPELCTITQLLRPQDTHCLVSFQALRWVLEPLADAKATTSTLFNMFKIEEPEKWKALREASLKLHYSSPEIHYPMVAFSVEPRLVCNVAQSIRYLRDQVNSQVADRLAIIANLCHFEKRLNTRELEGRSLSTCILVLALLNGDMSLFSGIYPDVWTSRSLNAVGKTWQLPSSQALKEVYTPVLGGANIGQIYSFSLTDDGDLDLEGHLWEVGTKVDFSDIQRKYAGSNLLDEDESNTMPIYRDIYWDILLHLNRNGYPGLVKAIWEIVRNTYIGAPRDESQPEPAYWQRRGNIVPQSFEEVQDPMTGEYLPKQYFPLSPKEKPLWSPADKHRLLELDPICRWATEKKVRLACQDLYQDSEHNFTAMMNKEWIANRIFTTGFIWCGRLS
ncbi:hypothetical protein ACMFMG_007300 [Clarireedia jacksonii]